MCRGFWKIFRSQKNDVTTVGSYMWIVLADVCGIMRLRCTGRVGALRNWGYVQNFYGEIFGNANL